VYARHTPHSAAVESQRSKPSVCAFERDGRLICDRNAATHTALVPPADARERPATAFWQTLKNRN
jgi:hypothetical protein